MGLWYSFKTNRLAHAGLRALILAGVLLFASVAGADWKVYGSADFGISTSDVETDGVAATFPLSGTDEDSSPLVAGAIGIEIPMDELVPREWLLDVRLPDWPLRFEFEGAGLREYEFRTSGTPQSEFFTEADATTFFFNTWLDVPLMAMYKPVQYMFGLGRQPRVRSFLEPGSIYAGAGIGFAELKFDGTDNLAGGSDESIDFAWNAGAGVNYAVTERVTLGAGYRFIGVSEQTVDLVGRGVTIGPSDDIDFDQDIHEFRMSVRVVVWEFLSPWR